MLIHARDFYGHIQHVPVVAGARCSCDCDIAEDTYTITMDCALSGPLYNAFLLHEIGHIHCAHAMREEWDGLVMEPWEMEHEADRYAIDHGADGLMFLAHLRRAVRDMNLSNWQAEQHARRCEALQNYIGGI